jgi:predicted pyridoxine 5'-phosphate oxidase superfamily flavin-nucleotide-binding protein
MAERVHDYHDGNRYWQDRFDTRRLADRGAGRLREHIDAPAREFIEGADMFFLATCDHRGLPTCSYKGGDPGFVRVLDASWLAFPNSDGNGKYQSMGNLLKNPYVGMLFMDFEQGRRLLASARSSA